MVLRRFLSLCLFTLLLLCALSAQQKYALVIGNGAYTSVARLNNPVNDANDISAVLRDLGFTVDQLTNADRVQMEQAVMRLKNRLSVVRDSYGFFFYAGHGVQSNNGNYLIPVDANIPSESYLADRSVSVQAILTELNSAGNALNIVVLDACRDNPFGWQRTTARGLYGVKEQPPGSIIMYATSAGATAADGTGRNGLFTTHLLNNLKKPGLSVRDVFDQTGADVWRASGGSQIPAIYSQFFDVAYLGTRTSPVTPGPAPTPAPQPEQNRQEAVKYVSSGDAYYAKGDYDRAIADYTQALRLDPDAVRYTNRGNAYRNKGDNDRAIADYNDALRLDPNYARAYNQRGYAYHYGKKDYDWAIADYNDALRLDPNFAAAKSNLEAARKARGW